MAEYLWAARDIAEAVRYSGDVGKHEELADNSRADAFASSLLQNELKITREVTPLLAERLGAARERLNIPEGAVTAFVYASPQIQAECFTTGHTRCVLRFSSALVDLLSPDEFAFVAGHELGHFLLRHGTGRSLYRNLSVQSFVESRAQEISSDRVGLIACESLEMALRALLKTISGLSDRHLRFDFSVFVSQLRQVSAKPPQANVFASHPAVVLRARALLWFSMGNISPKGNFSEIGAALRGIDLKIKKDMDLYADSSSKEIMEEAKENLLIWRAANRVIDTGCFSRPIQKALGALLGDEILEKIKMLFSDRSKADAQEFIERRLSEASDYFRAHFPDEYDNELDRIQSVLLRVFSNTER